MLTMINRWITSILILLISMFSSLAQSKLNIKINNPSQVDLCIESDYLEIEVRNTTTSIVSGIETQVNFPKGITYATGSLTGTGVRVLEIVIESLVCRSSQIKFVGSINHI